MRRVLSAVALTLGVGLLAAQPANATLYAISLVGPQAQGGSATVSGTATVEIAPTGPTKPAGAAYVVAPQGSGWDETSKVGMSKSSNGHFYAPLATGSIINGTYSLYARAWGGELKQYDPGDPSTYASDSLTLLVDNAPGTPQQLQGLPAPGAAILDWGAVTDSDRGDFVGYRVYVAAPSGDTCPDFGDAYRALQATDTTRVMVTGLDTGGQCFRVTAVRTSPVSGTIESGPSDATRVTISSASPTQTPGGGATTGPGSGSSASTGHHTHTVKRDGLTIVYGSAPAARAPVLPVAPLAPVFAGADPMSPDGPFSRHLPYRSPRSAGGAIPGAAAVDVAREAGAAGASPYLFALGGVLVLFSMALFRTTSSGVRGRHFGSIRAQTWGLLASARPYRPRH
ncbi:MAG: hypothetical protein ABR600_00790 [Actinomycetota bacterium]